MDIDWNLARAFLATVETGSLSAAARRLGLTQPTLSRQVLALEETLGVALFERTGKKLTLTETGQTLVAHVRSMGDAATSLGLAASGRAQAIEGRVAISASNAFAAYVMPEIIAYIREAVPQVTLAVISSNALSDLRRREADIAIRHVEPQGDDLVGELVRESTARFYASPAWIERNGLPRSAKSVAGKHLISLSDVEAFAGFMRAAGFEIEGKDIRIISEDFTVGWEMVRRGLGIGPMMAEIAARTPDVVELPLDIPPYPIPLWLVTHRELRSTPRIRVVFDLLAQQLARL